MSGSCDPAPRAEPSPPGSSMAARAWSTVLASAAAWTAERVRSRAGMRTECRRAPSAVRERLGDVAVHAERLREARDLEQAPDRPGLRRDHGEPAAGDPRLARLPDQRPQAAGVAEGQVGQVDQDALATVRLQARAEI